MEKVRVALTHPSYAEHRGIESNQALETVGDAILDHLVAKWLYRLGINTEKEITNIRSRLVSNKSLAKIGDRIGLKKYLKVYRHRVTPKDVADGFESFIGALSLEFGQQATEEIVYEILKTDLYEAIEEERKHPQKEGRSECNPVNRLQEFAQEKDLPLPKYSDGEFNGTTYKVVCHFNFNGQKIYSYGVSRRKKEARKKAASFMLQKLGYF